MQNKKNSCAKQFLHILSIQIYVTYSFKFTEAEKNKTQKSLKDCIKLKKKNNKKLIKLTTME